MSAYGICKETMQKNTLEGMNIAAAKQVTMLCKLQSEWNDWVMCKRCWYSAATYRQVYDMKCRWMIRIKSVFVTEHNMLIFRMYISSHHLWVYYHSRDDQIKPSITAAKNVSWKVYRLALISPTEYVRKLIFKWNIK